MKLRIFIIVAAFVTTTVIISAFKTVKTPADKGFAVVELFTSEGCSSCPPADALIAKVHKETSDKPIYILAYHVDYWDRLGWKDAFSNSAYSDRQKQYARWLRSSEIYTPQAVVNGSREFVGSEENTLRNTIKADLAEPAKTDLSLTGLKAVEKNITVKYDVKGAAANSVLMVALVERNATSKVMKGENAGRTLSHVQIVRELQSVKLGGNAVGTASLAVPSGFTPQGFEMIAFVQNTSNGVITGAARAEFNVTVN